MKKPCMLLLFGFLLALSLWAAGGEATVQVKETILRDQPTFTGKTLGILKYGAKVSILEEKSGWARVSAEGGKLQGWVHGSAITKKSVALSSQGGTGTGATSAEVSLAGKGFSAEVEAQYRSQNAALDFATIDAMEKVRFRPDELKAFLSAGGILPKGGL